ncbi:hypothetical protein G6549_13765 [Bacillus sp. MM2020_1]|nr:hypothetical protein [Bacillus sp. MM2020_1]
MITAPTSPTKEGYTFGGWYKDAACTTAWDFVNDIVSANNITLYAKWITNNYTVNFDSQGGGAVTGIYANYHSKITAPTAPTKVGYTFGGWYKDAACTTEWDFANDTVSNNTTLYAKWTTNSYAVDFDSQGGSAVPGINTNYHSKITAPTAQTKVGYTFGGWYKDAAYTTAWDFENDTVPATGITLYAKWDINSYTVSFDSNGGSEVSSQKMNYDTLVTAPTVPTKVGYTFAGWYKERALITEWNFAAAKITANTTLYAKWIINSYTVTFNSQGGSAVKSVKVNYNALIQTPASPTRAGYTFVGWYKESSGVNVWSFTTQKVLNNTTLYAKWVANPTNPTNVKAGSSSYNSVNVSWGAVTGASGYEIYRATSSGGSYSLITSITKNSFSNTGLTANNMYYYKVRAYKLVGTTKAYSGWSVVVSAKPIPSTPVGLKLVKATTTSIKATWTAVSGATKYEVWVATSSRGVYAKKAEVSLTTGKITGLSRGKTYYIKVRAYRLIGKTKVYSGYSKVAALKI